MNNTTTAQPDIQTWQPTSAPLYMYVISGLVCGWTVGANAVILACFYLNRHKQLSIFRRIIISMAMSDLFVGLLWLIQIYLNRNNGRMIGLICNTSLFLTTSLQCVSLYHVLGICVLRNKVLRGLEDQRKRWTFIIIIMPWILSLIVIGIPIVIWARFSVDEIICRLDVVFGSNLKIAAFFVSTFYITSQIVTDVVYCTTVIHLWLEIRKYRVSIQNDVVMSVITVEVTSENSNDTITEMAQMRMLKYQRDITSTIGYLLVFFNLLTLPNTIAGFFIGGFETTQPNIILVTNFLFVLNSGVNPIVYATRIPWIKESLKRIAVKVTKCFVSNANLALNRE